MHHEDRFGEPQANRLLQQIREDMDVYDVDGNRIGEVEDVYFGEVSGAADARGQGPATTQGAYRENDTWLHDLAEVFAGEEDLPEVLRARLLREGFLRLDASGLLAADRYVLPDQIASVSADGVRLRVRRDELIKHD
jgi:hypothetical protein